MREAATATESRRQAKRSRQLHPTPFQLTPSPTRSCSPPPPPPRSAPCLLLMLGDELGHIHAQPAGRQQVVVAHLHYLLFRLRARLQTAKRARRLSVGNDAHDQIVLTQQDQTTCNAH
eukprot:1785239-Pleurochrysis_carterae.AAC.2